MYNSTSFGSLFGPLEPLIPRFNAKAIHGNVYVMNEPKNDTWLDIRDRQPIRAVNEELVWI